MSNNIVFPEPYHMPRWKNVLNTDKILAFSMAGVELKDVNTWVLRETEYEYFIFNDAVYHARSEGATKTVWKIGDVFG